MAPSENSPKVDDLAARFLSSTPLSPLSSPASSLPSVYSPGSVAATREKRTKQLQHQTNKYHEKPKVQPTYNDKVNEARKSFDTATIGVLQESRCLLNDQVSYGDQNRKSNGIQNNARPVLVAVRCRPRKRQRTKRQFATVLGGDEEVRHSGSQDSSNSSSSSSSSDGKGSKPRPSSGGMQRGVFEYSANRDYDCTATYDAKIPPPSMHRPRRMFVHAPVRTGNTSGRRCFDFDFIFPPWKKQRDVYDACVHAQIHHVLESQQQGQVQHATIVAYGQTGTGKTYTMGMLSDFTDDKEQGLIPRALSQILGFARSAEGEAGSHVVTLSFLQIYLETIQDLLALPGLNSNSSRVKPFGKYDGRRHGNVSSSDLPVRQGRNGAFYVTDLSEYEISTMEDAYALLELAMRNRFLAATTKNKTSSRSHTLLTISIKRRRRGIPRSKYSSSEDEDEGRGDGSSAEEEELHQASTISFVDLAGSERVDGALHFLRATRARQEQRIREAKFINRSLSALGGVIGALAQPKVTATGSRSRNGIARVNSCLQDKVQQVGSEQGLPHIRFRDSQLTKLLQGRLMGGRGRLLLIATVDDQPKNLSETLSTLKFASQCRRVVLQPDSRLRGDRTNRLRRQKSLLDQVLNDMKLIHETREAALHNEYRAQIEVLERELEAARAAAKSPPPEDVTPLHLASYTALCSLVDMVCRTRVDQCGESKHPDVATFQSEHDMLEYIAGLYNRLKVALAQQQLDQSLANQAVNSAVLQSAVKDQHENLTLMLAADKPAIHREPVPSSTTSSSTRHTPARGRMQLSPEQEAEFRAVARHLITTKALDSFIVSSSDED